MALGTTITKPQGEPVKAPTDAMVEDLSNLPFGVKIARGNIKLLAVYKGVRMVVRDGDEDLIGNSRKDLTERMDINLIGPTSSSHGTGYIRELGPSLRARSGSLVSDSFSSASKQHLSSPPRI